MWTCWKWYGSTLIVTTCRTCWKWYGSTMLKSCEVIWLKVNWTDWTWSLWSGHMPPSRSVLDRSILGWPVTRNLHQANWWDVLPLRYAKPFNLKSIHVIGCVCKICYLINPSQSLWLSDNGKSHSQSRLVFGDHWCPMPNKYWIWGSSVSAVPSPLNIEYILGAVPLRMPRAQWILNTGRFRCGCPEPTKYWIYFGCGSMMIWNLLTFCTVNSCYIACVKYVTWSIQTDHCDRAIMGNRTHKADRCSTDPTWSLWQEISPTSRFSTDHCGQAIQSRLVLDGEKSATDRSVLDHSNPIIAVGR